jgi:hypothetical protein
MAEMALIMPKCFVRNATKPPALMETQTVTGRERLTAEKVLRCVALKQYRNLSYEELAFHL